MAQCEVIIGATVTDLGSELQKRCRFTTTAPEAISSGYGTIAAADTFEAVPMGQVAASLVDGLYIKSIGNTLYIDPSVSLAGTEVKRIRLDSGESAFFRPVLSDVALSVMILCSTAEANYEYLIVGESS